MTQRYFYTDPLAAAWMVKHHGLKIHGPVHTAVGARAISIKPMPVWILARAIEAQEKGQAYEDAKYCIHHDSLHLLEPRVGDFFRWTTSAGKDWHETHHRFVREGADERYTIGTAKRLIEELHGKILERNNMPFIWPQSEEVMPSPAYEPRQPDQIGE